MLRQDVEVLVLLATDSDPSNHPFKSLQLVKKMSIGSAVILGATGQTGSALLLELLSTPSPIVDRVVAYGNSRMPTLTGPHADRATAKQVEIDDLN